MTKKTDKNTLVTTELELRASKRLCKKIFLYSIAVFFGSIFLKILFTGLLIFVQYLDIPLGINAADNIFSSLLIMISMTSFVTFLIGGSLWAETPRSKYDNDLKNSDISISGSHRMTNIHNMNNPANPLSYHHRNS